MPDRTELRPGARVGTQAFSQGFTAGLVLGNIGVRGSRQFLSARARVFVGEFWEFAAFIANSFVFLMIGLTVANIPFAKLGFPALAILIGIVLVSRALTVYPLCLVFRPTRWKVPFREQHILWWAGLRGALGLALALALPPSLSFHDEIQIATFAVAAFSIVLQGLTMAPLLRWLGISSVRGAPAE